MGSVFSPTYFEARAKGEAPEPSFYCALNVAVYLSQKKRWAFTEYPVHKVQRHADEFVLGHNRVVWSGQTLKIELFEHTTGLGRPVRGTIELRPRHLVDHQVALDPEGKHHWWPVAPLGEIDVQLTKPRLRFVGSGYHDANFGHVPLEESFHRWSWSRAERPEGAAVIYDTQLRARPGSPGTDEETPTHEHGLLFRRDGSIEPLSAPKQHRLPYTRWGLRRRTRADEAARPKLRRTLEDTPFYTRSLIQTTLGGSDVVAMHESLSLDRFAHPLMQKMLPYRMRRGDRV